MNFIDMKDLLLKLRFLHDDDYPNDDEEVKLSSRGFVTLLNKLNSVQILS